MKITCLVDNAVEPGTRLWGEHGLSLLIESHGERLLFDTGASGSVLLHNMQALSIDPHTISALAISHAHRDHTGGLPSVLGLRPGLSLYANGDLLRERFSQRVGSINSIGLPVTAIELQMKRLNRMGVRALHLNHCTGLAAYMTLALAFGDRVHPCPAGTELEY